MKNDLTVKEKKTPKHKKYVLKKRTGGVTYKVDYENELNEAQFEAVQVKDGAVLVIAGAGTGRTGI